MTVGTSTTTGRGVNQIVGWIGGLFYLLVGLLGFTVSGGHDVAGRDGGRLLGLFEVNVLHNIVHLLVGAVLILGAMAGVRASRAVNTTVGLVYLVLGLIGLFIRNTDANILALNRGDNWLHLISGAVLLLVGLFADRGERAGQIGVSEHVGATRGTRGYER